MERAKIIMDMFNLSTAVVKREFTIGKRAGCIIFNPDLSEGKLISSMLFGFDKTAEKITTADALIKTVLYSSEAETMDDYEEICYRLMCGDCVVVVDGLDKLIVANARQWTSRAVQEPPTETVISGPREGFTEDFRTSLSLIERRIHSRYLCVERMRIGRLSATSVAIIYVSNVAKKSVVAEVKKRLQNIDVDAIYDTHNLCPYLEYNPLSLFKQVGYSERPDEVASKLLEGRVAIMVEGSPMVLTVPYLMIEDVISPEDYYQRSAFATFLRFLRLTAVLVAIVLPGIYVTVQVYNYEIVPIQFLITLMNAVKASPLPPLAEMLLVILLFEVIREAVVRMPKVLGVALSIAGAIVLGETAVNAGILSSPSILISAISSIALFTVPNQFGSATLLRLAYTIVGGVFGLFGVMLASVFLIYYLSGIESYGSPYLSPLSPLVPSDLKDSIIKKPFFDQQKRPRSVGSSNITRQGG